MKVELDKEALKVIKKVILEGKRNYSEEWWDITIKNEIQENYVIPKVSCTIKDERIKVKPRIPITPLKQQKKTPIMHKVFGAMEALIQHKICDQAIRQQKKIDHHMNVILRKNMFN